jgi:hypothetical protein
VNVSQVTSERCRIVCPKPIAPLRLLRCEGHGGRWRVRWHVVYPDGEINPLVWTTRRDAMGQASFAVPFWRAGTKNLANEVGNGPVDDN